MIPLCGEAHPTESGHDLANQDGLKGLGAVERTIIPYIVSDDVSSKVDAIRRACQHVTIRHSQETVIDRVVDVASAVSGFYGGWR